MQVFPDYIADRPRPGDVVSFHNSDRTDSGYMGLYLGAGLLMYDGGGNAHNEVGTLLKTLDQVMTHGISVGGIT